jgi:hypothetical protein
LFFKEQNKISATSSSQESNWQPLFLENDDHESTLNIIDQNDKTVVSDNNLVQQIETVIIIINCLLNTLTFLLIYLY